jgi:hypothetical protein
VNANTLAEPPGSEVFTYLAHCAKSAAIVGCAACLIDSKGKPIDVATAIGGVHIASGATTEQMSAVSAGAMGARASAKALSAGLSCYRHPFICAAVGASGI